MVLKKALLRGLAGIPIGATVSYVITIILSLFWGDGSYAPVVPSLVETMGTEIGAVALQFGLSCVMGFVFSSASAIWEVEKWSLAGQTLCHFFAISLGTMPIVWALHWAEYTPGGILGYFGIFVLIYAVLWLVLSASIRKKVRQVNKKLMDRGK